MNNSHNTRNTPGPKVVLDTNVYISAIIAYGVPRKVLELAQERKIALLVSEPILSEIKRVLQGKLHMAQWQVAASLLAIKDISTLVSPNLEVSVIKIHEADNRIIECAVEGRAQYIVFGDRRHILPLKEYKGIKILSPAEFLREIEK